MVENIDQDTINKVKREMELVKFFVFNRHFINPKVLLFVAGAITALTGDNRTEYLSI